MYKDLERVVCLDVERVVSLGMLSLERVVSLGMLSLGI